MELSQNSQSEGPTTLALLSCGDLSNAAASRPPDLFKTLRGVQRSQSECERQLRSVLATGNQACEHLGPILLRKVLELCFTAIQCRIDPARILSLLRSQEETDYDPGVSNSNRFNWTGDVIAKDSISANPWHANALKNGPTRSVFGSHVTELVLKPAAAGMVESEQSSAITWVTEVKDSDLLARARSELGELYSILSKGVHGEYLVRNPQMFDRVSMLDYYERGMKWLALIACSSHFSDIVFNRLSESAAFGLLEQCQNEVESLASADPN